MPAPAPRTRNIASGDCGELTWTNGDLAGSLERLRTYALATAERSEAWYWKRKTTKARFATAIQWSAILAAGLAGLVPIAAKLSLFAGVSGWLRNHHVAPVDSGLLASLLIGTGAALLSIDRVAGMSSGWTRYVLTATAIRSASEEFRMDWAALSAKAATPPTPEQSAAMIQRAKVFRLAIEGLINKETQDWATEFRQNMSSLERDLKVQIDQAKAEREKAAQPGSIEVNVPNANVTDDFRFEAQLSTETTTVVEETVIGSQSWTRIAVPAGQYKVTISGTVNQRKLSSSTALYVKPGESTKSQLSLPPAPAART